MEYRAKPTPQEWRGYQRLGAAVIASAVHDFEKPTRVGGESLGAGELAWAFLAVSNPSLEFWCRVADFDMNAILRKYRKGGAGRLMALSRRWQTPKVYTRHLALRVRRDRDI